MNNKSDRLQFSDNLKTLTLTYLYTGLQKFRLYVENSNAQNNPPSKTKNTSSNIKFTLMSKYIRKK